MQGIDKPKGGRGHHAPYLTTHLRVPIPVKDEVQGIIDRYREDLLAGRQLQDVPSSYEVKTAIAILTEALSLKANAGGAIKAKIREAVAILERN